MKKIKIGIQPLVGLGIGLSCILIAIFEAGELSWFWNLPSLLIICGGTIGSAVLSFPFKQLKTIGAVIKKAFTREEHDIMKDIEIIVNLSETARREGLLALEKHSDDLESDPFLKKGILLLIDGKDKSAIKMALLLDMHSAKRRHAQGYSMLDFIASTAPALGLLGTYVGLIPMLQQLSDPESLGPLMAVELVSSFYGAFIAYILFAPMAKRLKLMSSEETIKKELIMQGVLQIADGVNPRQIRENLLIYLTKLDAEALEGSKKKKTKGKKAEAE